MFFPSFYAYFSKFDVGSVLSLFRQLSTALDLIRRWAIIIDNKKMSKLMLWNADISISSFELLVFRCGTVVTCS